MKQLVFLLPTIFLVTAAAAPVTVYYSGSITSSDILSVPVGTIISGSFTYDTSAIGTPSGLATNYTAGGGTAQIGSGTASSAGGTARVLNDALILGSFSDSLGWSPDSSLILPSAVQAESVTFGATSRLLTITAAVQGAAPPTVLTSFALPNPFPAGFSTGTFALRFANEPPPEALQDNYYLNAIGSVTFTPVPEPSSFALGALGVAFVIRRRYATNS